MGTFQLVTWSLSQSVSQWTTFEFSVFRALQIRRTHVTFLTIDPEDEEEKTKQDQQGDNVGSC